jgi:hypothetical protein
MPVHHLFSCQQDVYILLIIDNYVFIPTKSLIPISLHPQCCGDSRSYRAQTMRGNKSSRTKTRILNRGQPKTLYSTIDFSKVDPLYKCRSVSFYREANGLFTFQEYPHVKRIKTECARLFLGNLQLGLHVSALHDVTPQIAAPFLLSSHTPVGRRPSIFWRLPFRLAPFVT